MTPFSNIADTCNFYILNSVILQYVAKGAFLLKIYILQYGGYLKYNLSLKSTILQYGEWRDLQNFNLIHYNTTAIFKLVTNIKAKHF